MQPICHSYDIMKYPVSRLAAFREMKKPFCGKMLNPLHISSLCKLLQPVSRCGEQRIPSEGTDILSVSQQRDDTIK